MLLGNVEYDSSTYKVSKKPCSIEKDGHLEKISKLLDIDEESLE